MNKRLQLHEQLVAMLGSRNVYFQPPSTVKMGYPCIIYSIGEANFITNFANGILYNFRKAYKVTVIDPNPDTEIPDRLLNLPYCRADRHYTADNLNHYTFVLYY